MKTLSLVSSEQTTTPDTWSYGVLGDHLFRDKTNPLARLFGWWSRHTSPPDARPGATFAERDRVRRARIASPLMLFFAILLVFVLLTALLGPNKNLLNTVYIVSPILVFCLWLNRKGSVTLVGILLSLGLVGSMCLTLATTALHGGIGPNDKDILYLLFFDEVFFAMLLPIDAVFLVAILDILISLVVLNLAPHTSALTLLLMHGGSTSTLFRIVEIHLLVPFALWVLVKTMQEQTERANTAEEVARLQHDLVALANRRAEEKAALEQSIAAIVTVHTRVGNGDLNARVPLTSEQALWNVAGQLNNLIARYQKARQALAQYEQLARAQQRMIDFYPVFRQAVAQAAREQRPLEFPASGTDLDPFLRVLADKYILTDCPPSHATNQLV